MSAGFGAVCNHRMTEIYLDQSLTFSGLSYGCFAAMISLNQDPWVAFFETMIKKPDDFPVKKKKSKDLSIS